MIDLKISVKTPQLNVESTKTTFNQFRTHLEDKAKKILLDTIHQEIVNRNLRVEGDLEESWKTDVGIVGDVRRIIATSDDIAAPALEYGTDEAQGEIVNVNEILNWASKKGINPSYGTLRQFAWAIAKKIGKQGLPLSGGLKRPFNAAQKKANRKIERLYEKEMELLVRRLK